MTTGQLLIVCLTTLLLTAAAAAGTVLAARQRAITRLAIARVDAAARIRTPTASAPSRVGERVTVHTKDERTIFGVIAGDYPDRIVLDHAEYVTNQGATPLPHRQPHIATRDIAWIDVLANVVDLHDRAPARAEAA